MRKPGTLRACHYVEVVNGNTETYELTISLQSYRQSIPPGSPGFVEYARVGPMMLPAHDWSEAMAMKRMAQAYYNRLGKIFDFTKERSRWGKRTWRPVGRCWM